VKLRSLILSLAAAAAIAGCGKSTDAVNVGSSLDSTPPPVPAGLYIDAVGNSGSEWLRWTPSSAADLANYQIFQYDPDPARNDAFVMVAQGTEAGFELPMAGSTASHYYYRVRAVDVSGNASGFTNTYDAALRTMIEPGNGDDRNPAHGIDQP